MKYRNQNDFTFSEKDLRRYKSINKVQKNKIVFLGAANISQINWCELYTYYKCKDEELMFMELYFSDLLSYSKLLRKPTLGDYKIKTLFNLDIAITVEEIMSLINKNSIYDFEILDDKCIDVLEMGENFHRTKAEQYKTVRWHLKQDDRIIIGVPDGIENNFVYEFKSTKNVKKMKGTALLQANIYAFMFNKTDIRVQIYDYIKDELYTYEEQRNKDNMLEILKRIENIENGNVPTNLIQYKCKGCCYRKTCIRTKRNK
jgi:CRISPR/Cas system-associated exonuclease Cas4 (RecB family)